VESDGGELRLVRPSPAGPPSPSSSRSPITDPSVRTVFCPRVPTDVARSHARVAPAFVLSIDDVPPLHHPGTLGGEPAERRGPI